MSNDLTTTDKGALAEYGKPMHHYGTSSCMEVSKQTFTEIEQIIQASSNYYKNHVMTQGVWPDRRIIFRSMSIQASQQFDSVAIMQLKNEFRGAFADITSLREENARLVAENEALRRERERFLMEERL